MYKKVVGNPSLIKDNNDVVINNSIDEYQNYNLKREQMRLDKLKIDSCMLEIQELKNNVEELKQFILATLKINQDV